jgi:hypothetical protein
MGQAYLMSLGFPTLKPRIQVKKRQLLQPSRPVKWRKTLQRGLRHLLRQSKERPTVPQSHEFIKTFLGVKLVKHRFLDQQSETGLVSSMKNSTYG